MLSMGEKKYLSVACVVPIDRFNVFDVQPTGKPDTDFGNSRRTVDLMCVLGALVPALVIYFDLFPLVKALHLPFVLFVPFCTVAGC